MKGLEEYKILEQERKVELAMQSIPATIKEIKKTALGSVFLKEFEGLDEHSKEVIENILDYMEKKYISVPMKMAKAVLLDLPQKN
jgi:glutamyl-tRNA reductase